MTTPEFLGMAQAAQEQGQWEAAAEIYEQILGKDQSSQPAAAGLGICLQKLGRVGQALPYLARVASQSCDNREVFAGLGNCYFSLNEMQLAVNAFRRAVDLDPMPAASLVLLAHGLVKLGEADEAEVCLIKALELDSNLAAAHDLLAFLLPQMGRFDEARVHARAAAALVPENPAYWVRYVYSGRVREEEEECVDRLAMMSASPNLRAADRIRVEYGLGKALEDLERYQEALEHYVKANAQAGRQMAERGQGFDHKTHVQEIDYLIRAFSKTEIRAKASRGSSSEQPVFIVGMMRSGTTLTEQILSSHPDIAGAGELDFWIRNAPQTLQAGDHQIARMARDYLELLDSKAHGKARVCDKMPQNYMSLGPIHCVVPRARIVHVKRDPRDTCLSIFTIPFAFHPPFAYSFKNLAFVYREYRRLMKHWRSVLPSDRFIEIEYEDLVADQQEVTRNLLSFLGLEWDEACLAPEKNRRLVTTPSRWQVRQPIYRKSVGRWQRFSPWLDSLLEGESFGEED